jgi:hypothetical protein
MKRGFSVAFFAVLFTCLLISSCESSPEPVGQEPVVYVEPDEAAQEETIAQEEPEAVVEVIDVAEETEPAEATDVEEESFAVSEEVYIETFEDIRQLIDDLNSIVRDENYEKWLKYLTDEYIGHFSSAEILKENSEQPLLKKYNISLSTMKDYFRWVVVPSRSNARLDDLVFIDNQHVKAIMVFNGQRTILYLLEKAVEGWKIGL